VDLESVQRAGFPVGGEPLIVLDLADTVMTTVEPVRDLPAEPERSAVWWALQAARLPESAKAPDPVAVRRLDYRCGGAARARVRRHTEYGGDVALACIAREVIDRRRAARQTR
jgi:hypothetical protein